MNDECLEISEEDSPFEVCLDSLHDVAVQLSALSRDVDHHADRLYSERIAEMEASKKEVLIF